MAARHETHTFRRSDGTGLTQTGTSASRLVERFRDKTVQVGGTFTATVAVEGSMDGNSWIVIGTPTSAPAFVLVPQAVVHLRVNVTAFTDGEPVAIFGGFDQRIDH